MSKEFRSGECITYCNELNVHGEETFPKCRVDTRRRMSEWPASSEPAAQMKAWKLKCSTWYTHSQALWVMVGRGFSWRQRETAEFAAAEKSWLPRAQTRKKKKKDLSHKYTVVGGVLFTNNLLFMYS